MLDLKFVRENSEKVKAVCIAKGDHADVDGILEIDTKRRTILSEVELLKKQRNDNSAEVARLKKEGGDASAIISSTQTISAQIKELDHQLTEVENAQHDLMTKIPNIPHDTVPHGKSSADNVVHSSWGEPKKFNFTPMP